MDRTYVVTGAASGIGASTARVTFGNAAPGSLLPIFTMRMSIANLATIEGRAALVEGVTRLSGGRIDAIVANAGGGPAETMLSLELLRHSGDARRVAPTPQGQSRTSGRDGIVDSVVEPC